MPWLVTKITLNCTVKRLEGFFSPLAAKTLSSDLKFKPRGFLTKVEQHYCVESKVHRTDSLG